MKEILPNTHSLKQKISISCYFASPSYCARAEHVIDGHFLKPSANRLVAGVQGCMSKTESDNCPSLVATLRETPPCRVPGPHGKAPKAHGKSFAVCRTRQSAHGNQGSAKPAFAVCYISGTRQRVCRVPLSTHGKKKVATQER